MPPARRPESLGPTGPSRAWRRPRRPAAGPLESPPVGDGLGGESHVERMAWFAASGDAQADRSRQQADDGSTAVEEPSMGAPGGDGAHGTGCGRPDGGVVAFADDVHPSPGGVQLLRVGGPVSEEIDDDDLA